MYLEKIIGTSTKVAALNVLLNSPGRRFLESELAREAGAAVSEINRQMPSVVQTGLVNVERIGKGKLYKINEKHFLVPPLRKLFADLNATYRKAAEKICKAAISSSKGLEAVVLVGSAANGKVRSDLAEAPSDIDMVFIVKNASDKEALFNFLISYINGDIASEYGIACYPIVMTRNEYVDALGRKERFVLNAQTEGVELYGKKPRRFGGLGAAKDGAVPAVREEQP
jgi:predicted nucleotidyltransferase